MSSIFETKKRYFRHKKTHAVGYLWIDTKPVRNKLRITITESANPFPPKGYYPHSIWKEGGVQVLIDDKELERSWTEIEPKPKT